MTTRYLLFLFFVLIVVVGCRKSKTSWDSDWVVPVFNDTLTIGQLVNDSTLVINGDNSLQLVLDRTIASIDIFELIQVPDTTIVQSFVISIDAIPVGPGVTYINEVEEHEFDLGDVVLKRARLKSGIAVITIENPIETIAIFTVELPGVTKNGVTFKQTERVPPKVNGVPGQKTFELDLAGYHLNLRGESGSDFNILQSKMVVVADPEGESVTLTKEDVVNFKVNLKNLSFDYAKGYFGSLTYSDTTLLNVEELRSVVSGKLNMEEVKLQLILENGIKAMAQGTFSHVTSKNNQGDYVALTHPEFNSSFNINPAQGTYDNLQISKKMFTFDNDNSTIQSFVEHLGSQYEIGYKVVLNPWGNTTGGNDELFPQSNLALRLLTDFPLMLSTENLVLRDTFDVDFSSNQKFVNVASGVFVLEVENGFPFGSLFSLDLLDEAGQSVGIVNASDLVSPSTEVTQDNKHIATKEEIRFVVNEQLASELGNITQIVIQAALSSATTSQNVIYSNAFIKTKLRGEFKLKTSL